MGSARDVELSPGYDGRRRQCDVVLTAGYGQIRFVGDVLVPAGNGRSLLSGEILLPTGDRRFGADRLVLATTADGRSGRVGQIVRSTTNGRFVFESKAPFSYPPDIVASVPVALFWAPPPMVDRSPYAMLEQEGNHKEELEAMKRLMFEKEPKYKQEQAKKEEELKTL